MRIQHNIAAMNSYRNYNNNTNALSKNLEKLSSGYKINRAGDDAAGLAISEKMRAQITGLDAAQKNVQDGISLVKTAEGAMQEIQDMLNRMDYLATQSANGTYENEVDRENLQKEVDALKNEINRIADSTNFNGIKLLDGSLESNAASTEIGLEGTELQDKIFKADGASATTGTIAAKGAKSTATLCGANDTRAANSYDAIEITFTNKDGVERTLTLVSNKALATAGAKGEAGKEIVALINNGDMKLSGVTSDETQTAYEEFKELFTVAEGDDASQITFTAKTSADPDLKAQVTQVKYKNSTTSGADAVDNLELKATGVEKARPELNKVTVSNTNPESASITIGDKTYTVEDPATNNTQTLAIQNLIKQLKADGYDVSRVDDTTGEESATGTAIRFNKPEQLSEKQKGTQITNTTDDKWSVASVEGTKGKAEIKIGDSKKADVGSDFTFTLNYVNAEGKQVSKEFTYKADDTAGENSKNLVGMLKNDDELSDLFDISEAGGTITLKNKGTGTGGAQVINATTNEPIQTTGSFLCTVTEGLDTGKELKLNTNEKFEKGDQITVNGKTYQFVNDATEQVEDGVTKVMIGDDVEKTFKNLAKALEKDGVTAKLNAAGDGLHFADNVTTPGSKDGGLTLQIGDTAKDYNQLKVVVGDMHTKAMGAGLDAEGNASTKTIADVDISSLEGAQEAVQIIRNAINYVSSVRGDLGATQNRLEHTANNLSVMEENITNAESAIRDTDIADEMTAYTKNNILLQSAQAMLAQANQMPQGVLQLLQ